MDAELERLIRQLPPDVQTWIRALISSGMTIEMLRVLLRTLIAAGGDSTLIMQILARLARLGMISGETLAVAAAEAEVIVAEAAAAEGAAGGGAAAAGGITAATLAAILFAAAAVAFAIWAIASEAMTEPRETPGGTPCGTGPAGRMMATATYRVTARAWGGITSYNEAIAKAEARCAALAANCTGTGNCPPGKTCSPSVSVQTVDQYFRFFYNKTRITFRCPCECK